MRWIALPALLGTMLAAQSGNVSGALLLRVQQALASDTDLPPFAVSAWMAGDTIELKGVVPDASSRLRAEQVAAAAAPGHTLRDELHVLSEGTVTAAANAATAGERQVPANYSATQMQAAVMNALLGDPRLANLTLTANLAGDGTVLLNGAVTDAAQRDAAAQDIQRLPGVRQVQNQIAVVGTGFNPSGNGAAPTVTPAPAVAPAPRATDAPAMTGSVQAILEAAFSADPAFAALQATVSGNDVKLAGSLNSVADRVRALALVKKMAPGMTVYDWTRIGH